MIVKVLCNSKGEYLKDIFIEDLSDFLDPTPCLGVAGVWKTTNPEEAMTFYPPIKAIELKSLLRRDWDYKNIEVSKPVSKMYY